MVELVNVNGELRQNFRKIPDQNLKKKKLSQQLRPKQEFIYKTLHKCCALFIYIVVLSLSRVVLSLILSKAFETILEKRFNNVFELHTDRSYRVNCNFFLMFVLQTAKTPLFTDF